MTSSPIRDLPLPLSASEIGRILGLKSLPVLTLIDLAILRRHLVDKRCNPALFLTGTELEKYATYSYPKRQVEWFGGRMAAKQAAIELLWSRLPSSYLDWQITPDENGRPFLTPADKNLSCPPVEISLSHSHELSVAIAAFAQPCGIDIQKTSAAVIRVQEKFCTAPEKKISETLPGTDAEMQMTLLWSAKESLRKARGGQPLTGFLQMELASLENTAGDCWTFSFRIKKGAEVSIHQVVTFIYQDYGCSVALGC